MKKKAQGPQLLIISDKNEATNSGLTSENHLKEILFTRISLVCEMPIKGMTSKFLSISWSVTNKQAAWQCCPWCDYSNLRLLLQKPERF